MGNYLDYLVPPAGNLPGLAAVLAVALGFIALGGLVCGPKRFAPADLVSGWGVALVPMTLFGVVGPVPFTFTAAGLAVAAVAAGWFSFRRDRRLLPEGGGKILALGSVLLLIVTGMAPSQWDEYSHWLLAGRYLFDVDAFPRVGFPPIIADAPAYPYGVPLVGYLASRLIGAFIENAGPLFNVLLLFSFGLAALSVFRSATGRTPETKVGWSDAALAILFATTFNTTFVQKVILTAYADLPSAAAVGIAAVLGWMMLERLARRDLAGARVQALQMSLALVVFLDAKETNVVIFVCLMLGLVVVALRDPDIRFADFVRLLPLIIGPPLVIYGLWRYHITTHDLHRAVSLRPFESWNFHLLPQMLSTIGSIMFKKAAYFGLMFIAVGFAIRGLVRFKGPLDRMTILVAGTFAGFNLFLVFAYLAAFGPYTAATAGSYWRYNMHLGLVGVVFAAYGAGLLWERYGDRLAGRVTVNLPRLAVVLVVALPVVFAYKLRFDVRAPKIYVRQVGDEIARIVPKDSRIVVLDPLETGFYAKQMRYRLYGVATLIGDSNVFRYTKPEGVRELLELEPTHIWVHTQNPAVGQVLGLSLPLRNSHLVEREGEKWRLVKSWPYPGYDLPSDIPD